MEEITLKVYLQPRSSKNEMAGPFRDGVRIRITAPPIEGKANEGLVRFLAKEYGIPPSHVQIIKGHHSREKIVKISGVKDMVFPLKKNPAQSP
jgi:uncharacterized protein